MALDNHFIQARGAEQERAFHTDTIGSHAADGDVGIVTALAHPDHNSLELLDAFAFAFFDLDMHADGVTGSELGDFFIRFGFESLDHICHCLSSLRNVCFVSSATADYSTHFLISQAKLEK